MSGSSAARLTARRLPARIARQFARAEELNPRVNAFTHLYSAQGEAIRRAGSLAGADSKSVQMQRRNRIRAHRLARWTGSASVSKTCSRLQMRRQRLALPGLCEVSIQCGVGVPLSSEPNADRHLRIRCCAEYRSPFDATVVQKLRRAGAVLTGKTNMDEFGMGCV